MTALSGKREGTAKPKDTLVTSAVKVRVSEDINLRTLWAILALLMLWGGMARAETVGGYDVERLANAIYKAEGGAKTIHPYGILAKYKHTTPRQACINTIRSKHREWVRLGAKGDYLRYLQSRYCPIGAKNDPAGLNKNWYKNVRSFYGMR